MMEPDELRHLDDQALAKAVTQARLDLADQALLLDHAENTLLNTKLGFEGAAHDLRDLLREQNRRNTNGQTETS